jgi:hypothetical protein
MMPVDYVWGFPEGAHIVNDWHSRGANRFRHLTQDGAVYHWMVATALEFLCHVVHIHFRAGTVREGAIR